MRSTRRSVCSSVNVGTAAAFEGGRVVGDRLVAAVGVACSVKAGMLHGTVAGRLLLAGAPNREQLNRRPR